MIIKEEGKEEKAVMRYLHDFVHIVYKPASKHPDEEIKVCCIEVIVKLSDPIN